MERRDQPARQLVCRASVSGEKAGTVPSLNIKGPYAITLKVELVAVLGTSDSTLGKKKKLRVFLDAYNISF